jgi:oxygen-independent coproporphyrinogen-3 oxidase
MTGKSPAALYVHLPFCRKKCPYCHFFVLPDQEKPKEELLAALKLEWEQARTALSPYQLTSIYFGGGTPSLFGPERIQELLTLFSAQEEMEITLEVNPEDVTLEKMQEFRLAGINRISLGVQSLDDTLLSQLGRGHSAATAIEAVHITKSAGFDNLTIDLMYDIPGQTIAQFEETLRQVERLPITHLSLYNLTFEPGTVFFNHRKKLLPLVPEGEKSLDLLNLALFYLEEMGLKRYEISAFARKGFEARHNTGYWVGRPFWGLGPSAFSYMNGKRFRNVAHLKKYTQALENNTSPIDFEEELPHPQNLHELLAIHLRLLEGVDLANFPTLPTSTEEKLNHLIKEGYLTKNERLQLTERGRLFYDSVATEII